MAALDKTAPGRWIFQTGYFRKINGVVKHHETIACTGFSWRKYGVEGVLGLSLKKKFLKKEIKEEGRRKKKKKDQRGKQGKEALIFYWIGGKISTPAFVDSLFTLITLLHLINFTIACWPKPCSYLAVPRDKWDPSLLILSAKQRTVYSTSLKGTAQMPSTFFSCWDSCATVTTQLYGLDPLWKNYCWLQWIYNPALSKCELIPLFLFSSLASQELIFLLQNIRE